MTKNTIITTITVNDRQFTFKDFRGVVNDPTQGSAKDGSTILTLLRLIDENGGKIKFVDFLRRYQIQYVPERALAFAVCKMKLIQTRLDDNGVLYLVVNPKHVGKYKIERGQVGDA